MALGIFPCASAGNAIRNGERVRESSVAARRNVSCGRDLSLMMGILTQVEALRIFTAGRLQLFEAG